MRTFPDGFLWGAATAAHQIEGNNVNSNWWVHENEPGTTIVEPSGDAADSYHRYREDVKILADLGLNSYRFSIEWARIEPERGLVSRASIDHYRRMVDTCLEFGVEPIVTLMHFTVPRWFETDGFWKAADAPELFARYTELALPVVSSGVKYVCTINEPNIAAMLAGGEDASNLVAYGLPKPDLAVADALLESHKRSREVLSQVSGLKTGWTVATQAFEAAVPSNRARPRNSPRSPTPPRTGTSRTAPATTSSECRPTPATSSGQRASARRSPRSRRRSPSGSTFRPRPASACAPPGS